MNSPLQRLLSVVLRQPAADPQFEELAGFMGVPIDELRSVPADPTFSYRHFTISKRGGGRRHIAAPSEPLKRLQRRLLDRYLAEQPVHEAATAFRRGGSIAIHARRHLDQTLVLTADLADFFPSTATWRVRRWFTGMDWQGAALDLLVRLCVYRGGLPQGAPTSPALSNLVNQPLDEELSERVAMCGGRYSRYCDDLAFSWCAEAEPPMFRNRVEDVLGRFGYRINFTKGWRLQRADERPEITGLVLDGRRLRLSEAILARIRRLKSRWFSRDPVERSQRQGYAGLRKMLKK